MSQSDTLAQRYGAPSRRHRRAVVAGSVLLALLFLGWLAWSTLAHADPDVRSELVAFDVVDEHAATARVDVRLAEEDVVATCLLRAISEDHAVVGELSFEVRWADTAAGSVLAREVRTERRATSVALVGCVAPGQKRPR